jgi:leucyl aminopeptidase
MKINVEDKICTDIKDQYELIYCDLWKLQQEGKLSSFFRKLGHHRTGSYRIIPKEEEWEEGALENLLKNAVGSIYDGAYRFSGNALRRMGSHGALRADVFEMRDELADYGTAEYTFVFSTHQEIVRAALKAGSVRGICKGYARTLGNLPNNYLHTEDMAAYAEKLGEKLQLSCTVLGDKELKDMGFGGILSVNQGSDRSAAVVILQDKEGGTKEKTALVGKGLMFDCGGYHLKSMEGMQGMKYDMCGAAGVLEALEILVREGHGKNCMAVLMLAENVIGPDAVKMGDVITTLSGKTVEIYNTDAEGRMVLCDGITYAQKLGAATVLDLATLTYSAQAALGNEFTGLFVNDEKVCRDWRKASEATNEKYWRLPLDESYHQLLEWSICADFANYAPGAGAGASVAASFLENFIEDETKWIHLDMVGPSVIRKETEELAEGASGAGISTIVEYVECSCK